MRQNCDVGFLLPPDVIEVQRKRIAEAAVNARMRLLVFFNQLSISGLKSSIVRCYVRFVLVFVGLIPSRRAFFLLLLSQNRIFNGHDNLARLGRGSNPRKEF